MSYPEGVPSLPRLYNLIEHIATIPEDRLVLRKPHSAKDSPDIVADKIE